MLADHENDPHDDHPGGNSGHGGDDGGHGHHHPTTILVNRNDVHMPDDHATGGEIKHTAGLPEAFKLFDPKGDEIANDQRIKLHEHERFTAISGQDVS